MTSNSSVTINKNINITLFSGFFVPALILFAVLYVGFEVSLTNAAISAALFYLIPTTAIRRMKHRLAGFIVLKSINAALFKAEKMATRINSYSAQCEFDAVIAKIEVMLDTYKTIQQKNRSKKSIRAFNNARQRLIRLYGVLRFDSQEGSPFWRAPTNEALMRNRL